MGRKAGIPTRLVGPGTAHQSSLSATIGSTAIALRAGK